VLSQDNEKLTAKTIIDYFNSTELVPLSVSQIMSIFDIFKEENILSGELNKKGPSNQLRTYDLLSFIKKFLKTIEFGI